MSEEKRQRKETIAALLHQTAEDHHVAFKETDGVDPDWSIWYAGHLLEKGFDTLLDAKLLKSDLIYLLVLVDKQQIEYVELVCLQHAWWEQPQLPWACCKQELF